MKRMAVDLRYLQYEDTHLPTALSALSAQFNSTEEAKDFYRRIATDIRKNQFLRGALTYHYLVKRGDWTIDAPDSNQVINYFTNSYKIVGIFAVIESLSDEKHQDFYDWLKQNRVNSLPIQNVERLDQLHSEYKQTFGSIRKCIAFFERLPEARRKELLNAVQIKRKPVASIKKLAEFLYTVRSKFVHEAELVLQLSGPMLSLKSGKPQYTKLTMPLICAAFEEGFVAYFSEA
jgi:hypothetical protein